MPHAEHPQEKEDEKKNRHKTVTVLRLPHLHGRGAMHAFAIAQHMNTSSKAKEKERPASHHDVLHDPNTPPQVETNTPNQPTHTSKDDKNHVIKSTTSTLRFLSKKRRYIPLLFRRTREKNRHTQTNTQTESHRNTREHENTKFHTSVGTTERQRGTSLTPLSWCCRRRHPLPRHTLSQFSSLSGLTGGLDPI